MKSATNLIGLRRDSDFYVSKLFASIIYRAAGRRRRHNETREGLARRDETEKVKREKLLIEFYQNFVSNNIIFMVKAAAFGFGPPAMTPMVQRFY